MPNRHLSRTIAMQSLYEWDFQKEKPLEQIIERNIEVYQKKNVDREYIDRIVRGVVENIAEIDRMIQESAKEWPLEQIPILDKTILRLSVYELLYCDDIPPKVSINEAVEIAKTFGGENTSKFVNGVLGTVYRASSRYIPQEEEIKQRWEKLLLKIKESQPN